MTFNYDNVATPWLGSYGEVPFHLDYPELSMSGAVLATAAADPDFPALSFMGRKVAYQTLVEEVERTARAFYARACVSWSACPTCPRPSIASTA